MSASRLHTLAETVASLPDPRSKQGVSHPYHGMLVIVILGILAGMPYVAKIRRWAKRHWNDLRTILEFKREKPPVETTFFRALGKTTLADLQDVFADFLKEVIAEDHDTIVAAVDGKTSKQMKDDEDDPLHMLNIFAHDIKVTLMEYDVKDDKTNEPTCLKKHIGALVTKYPLLKLLTGDAIFSQRPLLEALQEHGVDYLFQIKDNQEEILDVAKVCFAEVDTNKPDDMMPLEKKTAKLKYAKSGVTLMMPIMSANG